MGSRRRFRESDRPPKDGGITVGALAIGHPRANAVGPVTLTCEPHGLRIDLFGVGRFSAGFAFATLADAVSFRVPYRAVRGMVKDGRSLFLSLDPRSAAPYSRLALVRFSKEPIEALMRAFRARAAMSALSMIVPLPVAAAVTWTLHQHQLAGPVGLAAVGLISAVVCFRLLRMAVHALSWGGPLSDRLRNAFESRVASELGLEPALDLNPSVPTEPPIAASEPALARPRQAFGSFLRPVAFAIVGSLAVGAAAVAVVTVKSYGVADRVVLPVADARSGIAPPIQALAARSYVAGQTQHPSCTCGRVDSSLWRAGLPQISIVVSPIKGELDTVWMELEKTYPLRYAERERPRAELDLAIVNNSTQRLKSLDFVMTFAFRDDAGKRRNLRERGLHWPGWLGPGETVKWRVKAPGTEVKIETRHDKRLADVGVASAESFHPLRKARIPVVRLHGAMMLAMLRDEGATTAAAAARDLPERGKQAREELLRTLSPLAVCDIAPREGSFEACAHNGSSELLRSMTVVSVDRSGTDRRHVVHDFFHPGEGLRIRVPLEAADHVVRLER